jgi:hypothetical protein
MKRPVQYWQSVVASDGTSWPLQEGARFGKGGAAFAVKNTTMQDNAWGGLFLINSASVEVTDVVVQRSWALGIGVYNNSTAVFRGNVRSTESALNGIAVQSGSTLEIRGGIGARQQQRLERCRHRVLPSRRL